MWKKSETDTPSQPSSYTKPEVENKTRFEAKTRSESRSSIGASICINGDISGEEDLLIEGKIEGKILLQNHNVTIGKKGQIKAEIRSKTITIDGKVNGDLCGEEQIIIRQSGVVHGNIVAPRVVLEDGCNFRGNIDMSPKETATPASISLPSFKEDSAEKEVI